MNLHKLQIKDEDLLEKLNKFSDFVCDINPKDINFGNKNEIKKYISDEHLEYLMNNKDEKSNNGAYAVNGFYIYLINLCYNEFSELKDYLDDYLMMMKNDVNFYYPKGGGLCWHNDAHVGEHNLFLHYSEDGSGHFEYLDPKTNQKVRIQDTKGWSITYGFFAGKNDNEDVIWHNVYAGAGCRLTINYKLPTKHKKLFEEIIQQLKG